MIRRAERLFFYSPVYRGIDVCNPLKIRKNLLNFVLTNVPGCGRIYIVRGTESPVICLRIQSSERIFDERRTQREHEETDNRC